jgi:prepilin-type N-terminal cleavage/methylation domain-containing protein
MGPARLLTATRGGFTLIETIVATSISSVLLLTLGSTVLIASRAVPTGSEPVLVVGRMEYAMAVLRTDIEQSVAWEFVDETLTLKQADRTGDGQAEKVVYSIIEVAGLRRLVRVQNDGDNETLLRGIISFSAGSIEGAPQVHTMQVDLATHSAPWNRRVLIVRNPNGVNN